VSGGETQPCEAQPAAEALRLVHHHPGRLRLRSPALVGDDAAAARVRAAFAGSTAVQRVAHDGRSGSLVIEYEPGLADPDAIAARAAQAAGLPLAFNGAERPDRPHAEWFVEACRGLNASAYELTGRRLELRTLVPATLAGLSAVLLVVGKGPRLPRWDSLAYWSVTIFAMLHVQEMSGAAPGSRDRAERVPR
jgi:hypothetical protein